MNELVLQTRSQAFLLTLLERTARWPRRLRGSLIARTEGDAVGLVADLAAAEALRGAARRRVLESADARLASLRVLVRAAHDLGMVSGGAYAQMAEALGEQGRLLGAWIRSEAKPLDRSETATARTGAPGA